MTDDPHPVRQHYRKRFERRETGFWGREVEEAEATHFVLTVPHDAHQTEVVFRWPDERPRAWTAEHLLEIMFDKGQEHAKTTIRAALGVVNPRP